MSWPPLPELVAEIKSGRRSAEDTVQACLDRAEATRDYHAILELNQQALPRAREIDAAVAAETAEGDLLGVPFLVKDNFLTRETKTTAASRFIEDFDSPYQATAVHKLEAAGAIMLGKANLDEFAHGSSTENSAFGPTKNPHDKSRVPGGSSGGSAAAVALDIVPLALGTDTGGSIRLPASFCGVVGLKPTYGLVSRYGVIAMASSTDTIGPLTSSVSDSAYALDIMAGPDPCDSTTIERESTYRLSTDKPLKGMRLGLIKEHRNYDAEVAVRERLDEVLATLEAAGAAIEEISLPTDHLALSVYYILVPAEISSNLARFDGIKYGASDPAAQNLLETYTKSRGQGFGDEPTRRILTGTYVLSSGYQDAYYKQAQSVRTLLRAEYETALEGVDALIGPTAPTVAFPLGGKADPLHMYLTDVATISANLTGAPAISLPAGDVDGLPVGVQLMAGQGQDKKLLEIAAAVEGVL